MSILLSAYFPEGIVFAADKNTTVRYITRTGEVVAKYTEPTATKVLAWPFAQAVVGYVGLGKLANLDTDEWLRVFIAGTREFDSIDELAQKLRDRVQSDFDKDYAASDDVSGCHLIIHLGGFAARNGIATPVMYHIWNHEDIDETTGDYLPADRFFRISEDIQRDFMSWPNPGDYPGRVRDRLNSMVDQNRYYWFNNGANIGAFNVFKDFIWGALLTIRRAGFAPDGEGLTQRVAFCRMAVEVFGSYFTEHYLPQDRVVGGGVDVVSIPWPED